MTEATQTEQNQPANAGGNPAVIEEGGQPSGQQQQQNGEQQQNGDGTIASGAEAPQQEQKPYWPEDWKEQMARHASAGNEKAYAKELARLEKMASPHDIFNSFRSMETTWSSRRFVKMPGPEAKPEEIAEYHKAIGVPESPDAYLEKLTLPDGLVLGDWDKPMVKGFVEAVHASGATQPVIDAALGWYLQSQEEDAAALDDADDSYRRTSEQALKNEFGNAYQRYTNNIASVFATAPGGTDLSNEDSLYARLLGGRTSDGKMIGNDPDMVRWLVSLANNINPAGTVVDEGGQGGKTVDAEIAEIENIMRTDRRAYNERYANRYGELIAAREKIRARSR
jgi:hypothetical protein